MITRHEEKKKKIPAVFSQAPLPEKVLGRTHATVQRSLHHHLKTFLRIACYI